MLPTWLDLARSEWNDMPKRAAWKLGAPAVKRVTIESTADGTRQPALFYDSGSARKKPLLVVLHSWSEDYQQQYGLPYGVWAIEHDWVFVHPNYRGRYDNPEATASQKAQQDILDAVAYAKAHARVDPARVYLVGFSGGGMTSLIMAGRHPELWTAVVAWVPVFDLVDWYGEVRTRFRNYARDIRRSCGGAPRPGTRAERECRQRSPSSWLEGARGQPVRILIATGLHDPFVSPRHGLAAFNVLAEEADRLPEPVMARIAEGAIPKDLPAPSPDPLHTIAGRPLLLELTSGNVTLRIFDGRHDVVYRAGLRWLAGHSLPGS